MSVLTRRRMIRDLAAALAVLAGAPSLGRAAGADTLEEWLAAHLGGLDLTALRPAVAEFAKSPSGADARVAVLEGRRSGESMAALIERKCRKDFERGRVVAIAGWRLSLTEARLLSLVG